jgi:anthranilate synthase/aminodeoxychorismate synthase-like glutamine amidotransferase
MILLIDNYDSFTYNLYDYICQLGYSCTVMRNDECTIAQISALENLDCIVISPGPGKPQDAGISMQIIATFHQKLPILGICLGHQAIGEYFGAELVKAKKPMHGKTSYITFNKHFLFKEILAPFQVMRYHSLIIEKLPENLITIAQTQENEIMAISHCSLPIVGIQFHPESILTENGLQLLANFFHHILQQNT